MLTITQLEKNYKDYHLECSLKVPAGCVTGLIGKNGAGKSTTFKMILGLVREEAGDITLFGKHPSKLSGKEWERIGVSLSDSGFSGYLTIADIRKILANMYSMYDDTWFVEGCKRFELPFEKKIKDFSTGMRAKLKLLVAMCHKADFLILDEPTAGLDVMVRQEILSMLREYMEEDEQHAILISSHISSDLENLCDDIYLLDKGQIMLHEDTDVLLDQYAILKCTEEQFDKLDKRYLLYYKEEPYGYCILTTQRQFYMDNYKDIAIEKGNVDDLMILMIGGKKI